jgi:protein TonB
VVGGIVGDALEAPSAAAGPERVVRVAGRIKSPELVRRVEPSYPELAIKAGVSGLVILEAQVDARGHVKTVKVLHGHPLLDDAALHAVRQWRYEPLLLDGEPTEFIVTVAVPFKR